MYEVWNQETHFFIPYIFLYGSFPEDSNVNAINSQVETRGGLWLEANGFVT